MLQPLFWSIWQPIEKLWWPYGVVISEQNRGLWRNLYQRFFPTCSTATTGILIIPTYPSWFVKFRWPKANSFDTRPILLPSYFPCKESHYKFANEKNDLLSSTWFVTIILPPHKSKNTWSQTLWPNQPWFVATVCERRLSWRRCLSSDCRRGIDDSGGAGRQPLLCQRLHQHRGMAIKTSRDKQWAVGISKISSWAKELP